jgi:hypothetical protein
LGQRWERTEVVVVVVVAALGVSSGVGPLIDSTLSLHAGTVVVFSAREGLGRVGDDCGWTGDLDKTRGA